jgi:hypothetical protein
VLVAVEAWPAIVASTLVANFRRELLGLREVREIPDSLLPVAAVGFAVALTVAYACTAVFAIVVADEEQVPLRSAWEAVRPRLWILALCAMAAAGIAVPAVAVAADEGRGAYLLVNGSAVGIQLALLVTIPVVVLGIGRRREPLLVKLGRWLVTASVGALTSAGNLLLGGAGRALTDNRYLWWVGAAAVILAIVLNVLAIASLRAVRAGAAIAGRDEGRSRA